MVLGGREAQAGSFVFNIRMTLTQRGSLLSFMEVLPESVGPEEWAVIQAYQAREEQEAGPGEIRTVRLPKAVTAGPEGDYRL